MKERSRDTNGRGEATRGLKMKGAGQEERRGSGSTVHRGHGPQDGAHKRTETKGKIET